MRSSAFLVIAIGALAGCGDPVTPPVPSLTKHPAGYALRADANRYLLTARPEGWHTSFRMTFTNTTSAPVFLLQCQGTTSLTVERLYRDRWLSVWSPAAYQCLDVIEIAAGGLWEFTLAFFAGYSGDRPTWFPTEGVSGTYRVVLHGLLSSFIDHGADPGPRLLFHLRASRPFTLSLEPRPNSP